MNMVVAFFINLVINAVLLVGSLYIASRFVKGVHYSNNRAIISQGAGLIVVIAAIQAFVPLFGVWVVILFWLGGFMYVFRYDLIQAVILTVVVWVLWAILASILASLASLPQPFRLR
jgi:hypothetical protein